MGASSSVVGSGASAKGRRGWGKGEPAPAAKSPHDEALSFRGKCGALKIIVATDGSRRALMKYLERRKLEAYLNFYFEVEFLKTTNKEDVCKKADEIKKRFDPKVYEDDDQEPPEAVNKVWGFIDEDTTTGFESTKNVVAKDPVEILKLYKTWQSQVFDILSGYLNEFLESKEYKEWDEEQHAMDKNTALKKQKEAMLKKEQSRASVIPDAPSVSPYLPTVLLVDDSNVTAKVSTKLLEKNGHKVYTAFHGRDALETLLTVYIDVIVIDLFMPIMDGFEAIRLFRSYEERAIAKNTRVEESTDVWATDSKAKELNKSSDLLNALKAEEVADGVDKSIVNTRTIIVGMSADGSDGTVKKCLDAGADFFIAKPFTIPKMNQTLMQYIRDNNMPVKKRASVDATANPASTVGAAAAKAQEAVGEKPADSEPKILSTPVVETKAETPNTMASTSNGKAAAEDADDDDVEAPAEAS
jgi:CheY-like chemotaxis protein